MPHSLLPRLLAALALVACRADLPSELDPGPSPGPAAPAVVGGPAAPRPGERTPTLELPDLEGRSWTLAELQGRPVVLLWFDPECPFLIHAYGRGGLGEIARRLASQGVAWLAVDSNAPGRAGIARERSLAFVAEHGIDHPILIDEQGEVGRAFGARLAGEVLVLAPDGTLVYRGAIDNAPFGVPRRAAALESYVEQALEALARGERPRITWTEPYGCRIRYAGP